MDVCIKGAALERFVEEVAAAYYELCPDEAALFDALVREDGRNLVKPSGMSGDGHFMVLGHMPPNIYHFVKKQARKRLGLDDFWRDYENYKLFYRVWRNASVRRHRTPQLDLGAIHAASAASAG